LKNFDDVDAEYYIRIAMAEAEAAAQNGNRPFGAVIVDRGGDIAVAEHNRTIELNDPSAHAEIVAIRALCQQLGVLELPGYRLYTNAQSCPMCFSCIVQVQMATLVFAASPVPGVWPVPIEEFAIGFEHRVQIRGGVLCKDAVEQLERLNK
jgi:tRNA(Arg) A34 adenosine deaminase TadA